MSGKVTEAPLKRAEGGGLVPEGEGWFVVNVSEARAARTDRFGTGCRFEGVARFPDLGVSVRVVQPGQPACLYHRETVQEGFLVLRGECRAIIEEEERLLRAGDYLHTPAGTAHVIVGRRRRAVRRAHGRRARARRGAVLPGQRRGGASYGASVEHETSSLSEAYGGAPSSWPDRQWTTLGPVLGDG